MIARLLVRLAIRIAGDCPCPDCLERRAVADEMRRYRGRVPRRVLREAHRDSWRVGRRE